MNLDKFIKFLSVVLMGYVILGLVASLWLSQCVGAEPLTRILFAIIYPGIFLSGIVMVPLLTYGGLSIIIILGIVGSVLAVWFLIHHFFYHTIIETFVRFLVVFILFSFFFTFMATSLDLNQTNRVEITGSSNRLICFNNPQS